MKIVVNRCFGGFGLSHKAIMRYAELKNIALYLITEVIDGNGSIDFTKFRYCEYDENDIFGNYYITEPLLKNGGYKEKSWFSHRDIKRDDSILVQVVEELGADANGMCADLDITEIPDGIEWEIEEYDGREWISESHRTW